MLVGSENIGAPVDEAAGIVEPGRAVTHRLSCCIRIPGALHVFGADVRVPIPMRRVVFQRPECLVSLHRRQCAIRTHRHIRQLRCAVSAHTVAAQNV